MLPLTARRYVNSKSLRLPVIPPPNSVRKAQDEVKAEKAALAKAKAEAAAKEAAEKKVRTMIR